MRSQKARLHRDIESAGRFVHEDEARMRHEIARDLKALAHAARELRRLVVDAGCVDLDALQPALRGFADTTVVTVAHAHQALANVTAGGNAHAQAIARILMHEAPIGAGEEAPFGFREIEQVFRGTIAHAVAHRAGIGCNWPERVEQRRLAGAGFTDDGEHFAG